MVDFDTSKRNTFCFAFVATFGLLCLLRYSYLTSFVQDQYSQTVGYIKGQSLKFEPSIISNPFKPKSAPVAAPVCPYNFTIYVYDLFHGKNQDYLRESLQNRIPFCQNDCTDAQFATEIHIWRMLLRSPCRTTNPEAADLFYIPYQDTLEFYTDRNELTHGAMYRALRNNYTDVEEVFGITADYLKRYGGLDHVITLATPPFFERVLPATLHRMDDALVTTIVPELNASMIDHKRLNTQNENYIVMPYPVFNEPWVPVKPFRSATERRLLATAIFGLHGDGEALRRRLIDMAFAQSQQDGFKQRVLVAEKLTIELKKATQVRSYAEAVYNSIFCLSPAGDSLSTRRLFNALFAGCVPVLFGNDLVLPYTRLNIPYEEFILRIPSEQVESVEQGDQLFRYLEQLSKDGTAERMQQAMRKYSEQLRFALPFSEEPSFPLNEERQNLKSDHDAFAALMTELSIRSREVKSLIESGRAAELKEASLAVDMD